VTHITGRLALLLHVVEVLGSNLDPEFDYPDEVSVFSLSLQANAGIAF
jgi:hypothetical protein